MTADSLNVRQTPAGKVIDRLNKYKSISVIGKSSKKGITWLKVKYDKKSGYVSGKYIQNGAAPKVVNKAEPPVNSSIKKGIDISHINGAINFNSVKKDGYSFVIAKATEGQTTDNHFKHNIQSAKAAGLKTHAYHFFRAATINTAKKEADHFAAVLKLADFSGDAFIDVETTNGVSRSTLTNNVNAFLKQLKHDGYSNLGIYSNIGFYQDNLDASKLPDSLILWLARYRYEKKNLFGARPKRRYLAIHG
ncbi:GH25 family lysozyme [Terrilactibacillus sp. S3-3]|nr:GH25 family lysozyme [Terrilactibacillus sp. S3-3]